MGEWMAIGFVACALGLAVLHLTVFRWRRPRPAAPGPDTAAVSVVVAARNAYDRILENLFVWTDQDHPDFEIIIVDDHSDAEAYGKLEALCFSHPAVRLIPSTGPQGKKHAMRQGIAAARGPWILVTDADCRPLSRSWIRTMIAAAGRPGLVLGYSPYLTRNDELNALIRFETVMTAMQYMGWAMAGRPYMGVGRNMAFPRDWFMSADPLGPQIGIPYGDDDAIVQAATGHLPVHVCLDPASFIQSLPAQSLKEWKAQKHRHLSAGHQYHASARWRAMLMPALLLGTWLFYLLTPREYLWALFIGLSSLAIRWVNVIRWNQGLANPMQRWAYPAFELAYLEYILVMGFYAIVKPKKTWN
jgi:cellulose synthase/poly-beta-1,6-N-acetylglucosamine synthase-like glycosyltransferase